MPLPASKYRTTSNHSRSSHRIRHNIRQLVWNTHVGQSRGQALCFCCQATAISCFDFECGHIVARSRGGPDSVENLRPICGLCNRSMGTCNMFDFQRQHQLPIRRGWRWSGRWFWWLALCCLVVVAGMAAQRRYRLLL